MRYGTQSRLSPEEVLDRARDYFGPESELGLPELRFDTESATYGSDIGSVTVSVTAVNHLTDVTILSREYDSWAERFLRELH
jgi:hypothetical protein